MLAKEGASQSFARGDLVRFDTSGYVTIADSADIQGIAMEASHNTTAGLYTIAIDLVTADNEYLVYSTDTVAQSDVGELGDFTFTTTAVTFANNGNSGADAYIVRLKDGSGGYTYIVKFLGSVIETGTGSTT
jgi:hypothetical protein